MADAPKPDEKIIGSRASRWSRLYRWLDSRTGIGSLLHEALDEPIPGGARWAYVFGSVLLFLFISQTVTGIFLSLYYAPTADHAHTTVAYIIKEVTGGSFLRSLHAYGSSAVVIVVLLHLSQTFLYGAYKGRREVLWISGCALLGLMLAMAFTVFCGACFLTTCRDPGFGGCARLSLPQSRRGRSAERRSGKPAIANSAILSATGDDGYDRRLGDDPDTWSAGAFCSN